MKDYLKTFVFEEAEMYGENHQSKEKVYSVIKLLSEAISNKLDDAEFVDNSIEICMRIFGYLLQPREDATLLRVEAKTLMKVFGVLKAILLHQPHIFAERENRTWFFKYISLIFKRSKLWTREPVLTVASLQHPACSRKSPRLARNQAARGTSRSSRRTRQPDLVYRTHIF